MRMCAYKIHKFENIQNGNMLKEEKKTISHYLHDFIVVLTTGVAATLLCSLYIYIYIYTVFVCFSGSSFFLFSVRMLLPSEIALGEHIFFFSPAFSQFISLSS